MKSPLRFVVVGTLASNPYAGMAWMHMQFTAGLRRLGHDVCYLEATSAWPYDPVRQSRVCDTDYAVPYLARVAASFGLGERWAFRASFADNAWSGPLGPKAEELLATADAVFNVTGSTDLAALGLRPRRLVLLGTDPVLDEIAYASGDAVRRAFYDQHHDCLTYGENIGTPRSPLPPLPRLRGRTRQPVLLDLWAAGPPTRAAFTTVGNWEQSGLDIQFGSATYRWSKHHEFLKFIDLPRRIPQELELATNLACGTIQHGANEAVPAHGVADDARSLLLRNGWRLRDSREFTTDPWTYRDYVRASRGEFTVARDLNVRLRSGWFSERSACYLAAGRPVVTQDTGFSDVLPTGEGLFAFTTMDEILAAFDALRTDYRKHGRAAHAIAEEYFRAETVLGRLLADLGY